jgi:hypothetical protein
VWKARGNDVHRGIIATGLTLSDAAVRPFYPDARWRKPPKSRKVRGVDAHFRVPEGLPLWTTDDSSNFLANLNVAHARGGGVFSLTPAQWTHITDLVQRRTTATVKEISQALSDLTNLQDLDKKLEGKRRTAQGKLRRWLFGRRARGLCAICGNEFPVELLVASHIKRRADCSQVERNDYKGNLVPMCILGCDQLFERGYVFVDLRGNVEAGRFESLTNAVVAHLRNLRGKYCKQFTSERRRYFRWHARHRAGLRTI